MNTYPSETAFARPHSVAELQGVYAPFSFSEILLQKLWLRREFDSAQVRLQDGRQLDVLNPGRWNRIGGPDFKGAQLRIDGREITGDVEVHLHEKDWAAHAHADDPAYDNVVLHVVLFMPSRIWTRGADGREIPLLVLLPLLHHGLEEYAFEDAIESLSQQVSSPMRERLKTMGGERVLADLHRHAERRWRHKIHFARERIRRLGWDGACHFTTLEILGYSRNRVPMMAIATAYPLGLWAENEGQAAVDIDRLFAEQDGHWSLHGIRPLNHPRLRLKQYADGVKACPDWPEVWKAFAKTLPEGRNGVGGTRAYRHLHGLTDIRGRLCSRICNEILGGTRLDTLVCDGLLPLASAETGGDFQELWWHWFLGDVPTTCADLLGELQELMPALQACHGLGQGMLGLLLEWENETRKS